MSADHPKSNDNVPRLLQNETLLTGVLESSPVGTVLADMAGRVAYANPAFRSMLGYDTDRASVIGKTADDLLFGDFAVAAATQLNDLIAGRIDGYCAERLFRRRDGTMVWAVVSSSLLRDPNTGEPMFVIAQSTDIDRQKRAEEALTSVEQRWNLALEGAGQGVWDHNIRTGEMFYSRMWRIMRGFGPDEVVDGAMEEWLKRVHPDDRDRIREIVIQQDIGEIPYNAFEYRERHRAGHYIWILSRGRPVEWYANGLPSRIVGTDTDISNLKQAEADLAEEKERLNVTLHSIADGVISIDAAGLVTFINPTAEKLTGWPAAEAIGQPVTKVFELESEIEGAAAPPNPVVRCLAKREAIQSDEGIILVSRDGPRTHVRASASPVLALDGRMVGVVLVFQDVTQSRAQQKRLAHRATHDDLTGLPNRAAFERALRTTCANAAVEQRTHALCFIDLDRFKRVNDTAGHAAGDALLRGVGDAIRRNRRVQDFVARIGGDEFALLLADCSLDDAARIAEAVVDTITGIGFVWQGKGHEIGASVGIAAISEGADDPADVMERADRACYAAKAAGRNQVAIEGRNPAIRRIA